MSLAGACSCRAGSPVLRRQILFGRLVLHFLPMMLNDAPCGCSNYGVMAGYVTHHAADCRAFQAALGACNPWRHCKGCGNNESDNASNNEFTHFNNHPLWSPADP
jgi:hypothetical protein